MDKEERISAALRVPRSVAAQLADTSPVAMTSKTTSRSARWAFFVTGVFGIASLVLAVVGIAAAERGGDLPSGAIKVAGVDPVLAGDVAVDANNPIPITVTGSEGDRVSMGLTILGRTVGRQETPAIPAGRRRLPTTVTVNPWLLPGRTTAEVTVANDHRTLGIYRFGMKATQPASRTAVAAFVVVVAMMAIAWMEKMVRGLCRGGEPAMGSIGISVSAATVGAAAVALAWTALGREPTMSGLVGCVALATAAGVAVSLGARRVGSIRCAR